MVLIVEEVLKLLILRPYRAPRTLYMDAIWTLAQRLADLSDLQQDLMQGAIDHDPVPSATSRLLLLQIMALPPTHLISVHRLPLDSEQGESEACNSG